MARGKLESAQPPEPRKLRTELAVRAVGEVIVFDVLEVEGVHVWEERAEVGGDVDDPVLHLDEALGSDVLVVRLDVQDADVHSEMGRCSEELAEPVELHLGIDVHAAEEQALRRVDPRMTDECTLLEGRFVHLEPGEDVEDQFSREKDRAECVLRC